MKAKRISQEAVKNMINGNTALLHIGNFDTGKRTNLKRAVSECVYTSRLYYNKELQSDNEKIEYLVYSQPYRVFKVELYKTHIAAFNEYTEYHINFDDTSKYYTLVISGMQFLIVSDLGWCNIWQVFNTDTPVTTDCKQETEIKDKLINVYNELQTGKEIKCRFIKYKSHEAWKFRPSDRRAYRSYLTK
jgi:hypothetical protein